MAMTRRDVTFYPNAGIAFFFPSKEHLGVCIQIASTQRKCHFWDREKGRHGLCMCACVWEILRSRTPSAMSKGVNGSSSWNDRAAATKTKKYALHENVKLTICQTLPSSFSSLIIFLSFSLLSICWLVLNSKVLHPLVLPIWTQASGSTSIKAWTMLLSKKHKMRQVTSLEPEFYNNTDPKNRSFLNHTSIFVLTPARMSEPRWLLHSMYGSKCLRTSYLPSPKWSACFTVPACCKCCI